MIIIFLLVVYTTLIAYGWGAAIYRFVVRAFYSDQQGAPGFSITCLLGISGIMVIAGFFSLLVPLGGWVPHIFLLIPGMLFLIRERRSGSQLPFRFIRPVWVLFGSLCLMIFVMAAWDIRHPDTLEYHAQLIQWIGRYRVIPGIANLYPRYGLQSEWFVSEAIFRFDFLHISGVNILNTAVIIWYLIFLMEKIDQNAKAGANNIQGWFWIALLAFSTWSYTMIRLSVTSAATDFIVGIYILTIVHLVFSERTRQFTASFLLVITFSALVVTIKISAFPILLIPGVTCLFLIKPIPAKSLLLAILISMLIISPFLIRNAISSGYLLFPSGVPDLVQADWKFPKGSVESMARYITEFARGEKKGSLNPTDAISLSWIPHWFRSLGKADQVMIIIWTLTCLWSLLSLKSFLGDPRRLVLLFTCLLGAVVWFLKAPDPRFGYGFLIGFMGTAWPVLFPKLYNKVPGDLFFRMVLWAGTLVILFYAGYRFTHFFTRHELIVPRGINATNPPIYPCEGVLLYVAPTGISCGDSPVPCVYDSCHDFVPRGQSILDGFKHR